MAKRKPKSPEQIQAEKLLRRAKDFDAVNLDPSAVVLPAYADVQIDRTGRKNVTRAWRSNVFRLLLERKSITLDHFTAAEKLCADWAEWKGLTGARDSMGEQVDGGKGSAELVTDGMIRAGRRVDDAKRSLTEGQWRILSAFAVATVEEDRAMAWRGIMERLGITVRDRQPQAAREALEALRRHYYEPRARAA